MTIGYRMAKDDARAKEFIERIVSLCREYGLSIGHEDEHGAFLIEIGYDENYMNWLRDACYEPSRQAEMDW
jgi:hypothetical protein